VGGTPIAATFAATEDQAMARLRGMHANRTVDDAASSLQGLIDSGQGLLESLKDQQGAAAAQLRERVSAAMSHARDRLDDLDMPETASDAYENTVGYIQEDPWRAVAIGALALLTGSVLFRLLSND
jgi:ElaB/YqjD/DUF883 family membrane-anchored ribosome-binding protein